MIEDVTDHDKGKKRGNENLDERSDDIRLNKKVKLGEKHVPTIKDRLPTSTEPEASVHTLDNKNNKSIDKDDEFDKDIENRKVFSTTKTDTVKEISEEENLRTKDIRTKKSSGEKNDKHGNSKKSTGKKEKLFVTADKATQFKTAETLKSYLMKYYPSERIPDRTTFSKTCREMHHTILEKKIFDKEGIQKFVTKCLKQN